MNEPLLFLAAWIIPWLTGMSIWQFFTPVRPRNTDYWVTMVGYGYLIGVLLTGIFIQTFVSADTQHAVKSLATWLLLIAMLTWGYMRWRYPRFASTTTHKDRMGIFGKGLWLLLLILLSFRANVLVSEVLLRPTFPWDAWAAWAVKPKTWFLLGHETPYVDISDWLRSTSAESRYTATWSYPHLLAAIQIWYASGAGEWNESLINLAWCGVWLALLLGTYGQLRVLELTPLRAMMATYALGSLPLLNAHVALAGYADIWLAALFGLAVLSWLCWLERNERRQLLLAVLLGAAMPAIKIEGAIWLLWFYSMIVVSLTPIRWRWRLVGGVSILMVLGVAIGGFILPVLGLGWVKISWGEVDVPTLGALSLHWRAVGQAMLASLFTLPNWHLLWFLVPVVLVWRWREFQRQQALRLFGGLLLLCTLFLFVLFFFTEAARWAENFTSVNRLIMHITPVVITLLALLLRDADFRSVSKL